MIYVWNCSRCNKDTEVERKMADIEHGPDNGCENCGDMDLKRVIRIDPKSKNFTWNCDGNHDSEYTKYRSRK